MNTQNALKGTLLNELFEHFEICFLVFKIFMLCITFSHYWYNDFFNTEYKLLLMAFPELSKKNRIRSQICIYSTSLQLSLAVSLVTS